MAGSTDTAGIEVPKTEGRPCVRRNESAGTLGRAEEKGEKIPRFFFPFLLFSLAVVSEIRE